MEAQRARRNKLFIFSKGRCLPYSMIRILKRPLLANSTDVSSVARRTGYKSASQFSSDYRRMFSVTPTQDMRHSVGAPME